MWRWGLGLAVGWLMVCSNDSRAQTQPPLDPFLSAPPPRYVPPRPAAPPRAVTPPAAPSTRYPVPVGQSWRDWNDCPELVVIPAGRFTMGSPTSEPGRDSDEGPQHEVVVRSPLVVGKYEVTFDEWDACVAGNGCGGYRPEDRGWGRGRRPVITVSWDDAQNYVRWLSARTGQRYRLLTEAEWEYAARAGTATPFSFGATISTEQANYDGNYVYGAGRRGVYLQQTVPVGSLRQPNRFGLHDMYGNVSEWVEDLYVRQYAGPLADASVAVTTGGTSRVLRGGSWFDYPQYLRSADRNGSGPDVRNNNTGFRVARTPGG